MIGVRIHLQTPLLPGGEIDFFMPVILPDIDSVGSPAAFSKGFYLSRLYRSRVGISMRLVFIAAILFALCLMLSGSSAQSTERFQSVGGEYARAWLANFQSESSKPVDEGEDPGLWGWGSAPKGSMVIDGQLIGDPRIAANKLNVAQNWLAESLMDPYSTEASGFTYTDSVTGEVVKTFIDPATGESYYKYNDPVSGKLIYVYFNPLTGVPTRISLAPDSAQAAEENSGRYNLPSIFS